MSVFSMGTISYWIFLAIAGICWLGMLTGLLTYWLQTGRPHYHGMHTTQTIAFISDVGAFLLKPLFISASGVTTSCITLNLLSERVLRNNGRLIPNYTDREKELSVASIMCGVIGARALMLLTIYDTEVYPRAHNVFLSVFLAAYVASAICSCLEYQSLAMHGSEYRILRISFQIKLVFIIVEVALAIAFAATLFSGAYNCAAVLEWTLAYSFGIYIFTYAIDLLPIVPRDDTSKGFDVENKDSDPSQENRDEKLVGSVRVTGWG